MKAVKKLEPDELIALLDTVLYSSGRGLSDEQIDENLFTFCLNCPDPRGAMEIVLDAPRGSTAASVVAEALAMPQRSVASWSDDELSSDHPLRHWKLEA
jgi:hypothetical protein